MESVRELLARIERLESSIEQLQARDLIWTPAKQVRLAETVVGPGSYPAYTTAPDTYWISFVDASFTESTGDQTPTWGGRQSAVSPLYCAHNLGGAYMKEGSRIIVAESNGQWWFNESECRGWGLLTGTVTSGTSPFTIDTIYAHTYNCPTPASMSIYNTGKYAGGSGDVCFFEWVEGDRRFECYRIG